MLVTGAVSQFFTMELKSLKYTETAMVVVMILRMQRALPPMDITCSTTFGRCSCVTGDHLNLSRNDQRKALSEKSHSANPLNFSLACDGLIHRIVRKKIGINVIHTKLIFDTGESHACHRTVKYRNINTADPMAHIAHHSLSGFFRRSPSRGGGGGAAGFVSLFGSVASMSAAGASLASAAFARDSEIASRLIASHVSWATTVDASPSRKFGVGPTPTEEDGPLISFIRFY